MFSSFAMLCILEIHCNSCVCVILLQQVMKFAEMSQEVQIARPTPVRLDFGFTPGRRKANQVYLAHHNWSNISLVYELV